ncbi:hypothetical protein MAP00_000281 [Monascus purpureus]|nr:hypothetical protein MAP00_000281 [Monascus purpureus]
MSFIMFLKCHFVIKCLGCAFHPHPHLCQSLLKSPPSPRTRCPHRRTHTVVSSFSQSDNLSRAKVARPFHDGLGKYHGGTRAHGRHKGNRQDADYGWDDSRGLAPIFIRSKSSGMGIH